MRKLILCPLLAVLLSACDGAALQQLQPGVSRAADVRAALGEPTAVWPEGDGEVWEFSRQPEGSTCYQASMSADGVLQRIVQIADNDARAAVRPGMNQIEVRRRLCKPARTRYFELKHQTVWSWRVDGEFPGERRDFEVTFNAAGAVVDAGYSVDPHH